MDYKKLGYRIASRRRELGLKQSQVNEAAGLSDKYLSNIERATSVVSLDVLMRLCDALDTTPDRLLLDPDNKDNHSELKRIMTSKADMMTSDQLKLVISLMDWIITQRLG